jgi:hypothetical protein
MYYFIERALSITSINIKEEKTQVCKVEDHNPRKRKRTK